MSLETELPEPEVMESEPEFVTAGALAQINASEINQMVATAKRFPRSLATFRKTAHHLATVDQETAESCTYALPRDGKIIKGPSARFAEIIAHSWGNNRHGSRIVEEGTETVKAQGFFFDVESNVAVTCEVTVRIVDKEGRRYSLDMIVNSSNSAASKADRNAVLKGIPRASWQFILDKAQATAAGDEKTMERRRDIALEAFKKHGLGPAIVCQIVGIEGVSEMTIDHITTLQAVLNALKDGEITVQTLMKNLQDQDVAEKGRATVDRIKAKYAADTAAAQRKLDEKRKQAKAKEPAKAADVVADKPLVGEKQEEPF